MPFRSRYSLVSCLLFCPTLVIAAGQFQTWYPWFAVQLQTIMEHNCSYEYQVYLSGNVTEAENILYWSKMERDAFEAEDNSILTEPVINCIIDTLPGSANANMAVAAVFLGLVPTFLSTIGLSTVEAALLSLVTRRPLLALFLTAGSPAVVPLRASQYYDVSELLQPRKRDAAGYKFPRCAHWGRMIIPVMEYALAAASVANIAETAYTLGIQTINSNWSNKVYLPLLWTFLAPVIHMCTCLTFWFMVKIDTATEESENTVSSRWQLLLRRAKLEFTPAAYTTPPAIRRVGKTIVFPLASWFTEICTICHIVFGTTVLSGAMFIGARDALFIGLRYLASTVCCRIILSYETAGLRQTYALRGTNIFLQQIHEQDENDSASGEALTKGGKVFVDMRRLGSIDQQCDEENITEYGVSLSDGGWREPREEK